MLYLTIVTFTNLSATGVYLMEFKDQVKQLGERILKLKDNISTEEATKTALVLPMLQILGYDVFNPLEVVPEFTCDIGIKKGEKIDYAILENGSPLMLIECKHWNKNLNLHESQLIRYFQASHAKFGILTNGISYRFYTDLARQNVMDEKPFLDINITALKENEIDELKKFHKSYFDMEGIVANATDLKYMNEIRTILNNEMASPSDWFVRGIAKIVNPGMVTAKVVEQFTELIKRSFSQVVNDIVTERLKTALNREEENSRAQGAAPESQEGIVTTEEEMEGFYSVRAALNGAVDLDRVVYRDTLSYFGILLDDNNRTPICRLHFNSARKYIEVFDENKKGKKYELTKIADVANFKDDMIKSIQAYDAAKRLGTAAQAVDPVPVDSEPKAAHPQQPSAPKPVVWFYFNASDERIGPIDSSELVKLAASGGIHPNTVIETASGRKGCAKKVNGLVFNTET